MTDARSSCCRLRATALCFMFVLLVARVASSADSAPILSTVFPAGCQAGHTVDLMLSGTLLDGLHSVQCNAPGVMSEILGSGQVRLTVPAGVTPGCYDLWAVSQHGISSPRTFVVSSRTEVNEAEPDPNSHEPPVVPLNSVVNGRIQISGDVDSFCFEGSAGQHVILDCAAERIDSRLRAVLSVFNERGQRLAVSRGYFGIDPLIALNVPEDGRYVVQIQDLTSTGSAEHQYRLSIDNGPRVLLARPDIIQRGTTTSVELYGWNLQGNLHGQAPAHDRAQRDGDSVDAARAEALERIVVNIAVPAAPAAPAAPTGADPVAAPSLPQRRPAAAANDRFDWYLPGSQSAISFDITDLPVLLDEPDNHSPEQSQNLQPPCIVAGRLADLREQDWYAVEARKGEVFFIEATGHRLQAPVDLEISVFDMDGRQQLMQFSDELRNIGGPALPTDHLDPGGRWVAPHDGRFLISVRNISGGRTQDARRIYRLEIRREEPGLLLLAVPRRDGFGRMNLPRGGRELLEIIAIRQRGLEGAIRISSRDLPSGVECPDVWIGPGVDRAVMVVSADHQAEESVGRLRLTGSAAGLDDIPVHSVTTVRDSAPKGWSRLISQIPLAIVGDASLKITANGHEPLQHHLYGTLQVQHSPGGILDVAVQIDRRDAQHQAEVRLCGTGLPEIIRNQTAVIPKGQQTGYLSFSLPPTMLPGRYSLVIQAETTVPTTDGKSDSIVAFSDAVAFDVHRAAFQVELDPFARRTVRRGETFQVGYVSRRQNGFIGKMHTELAAPGIVTNVPGLRGRGETFTGQTDHGSLQIEVNHDAPLGHQSFLRLLTVGVVEDQPVFFSSCFLPLEIVE